MQLLQRASESEDEAAEAAQVQWDDNFFDRYVETPVRLSRGGYHW